VVSGGELAIRDTSAGNASLEELRRISRRSVRTGEPGTTGEAAPETGDALQQVEDKLEKIREAPGVTVDINWNGGGEEECRLNLEGNPTFMGHSFRLFLRECLEQGIGGTAATAGGGLAPNGTGGTGGPCIMEDKEVEVRFAMPERHTDAVRGENDEVLRRITEDSGCRELTVTFDLDDDSLALAVVQGTFKSCVAAQRALHEQLARVQQEASEDPPDRVTLTYLVPRERAGAVVGKAGQGLRQIRESTKVRVDLAQDLSHRRDKRARAFLPSDARRL